MSDGENGNPRHTEMRITTRDGRREVRRVTTDANGEPCDSYTKAAGHSTAARIDKQYRHDGATPLNPDKSSARRDDAATSSAAYYDQSQHIRDAKAAGDHGSATAGSGSNGQATDGSGRPRYVDLNYHHPLEDVLERPWMRELLRWLSEPRTGRKTRIEEMLASFANRNAPLLHRIKYWPVHAFINRVRGSVPRETVRERLGQHVATVRGLVITARSVAEYGLTLPQRFTIPFIVVWNFTNACNLRCKHCYQDSEHQRLPDELSLEEKLDIVDQMGAAYVPMIAFAGGEPAIHKDLLPVLKQCQKHGIHTTLATNGTVLKPKLCAELAESGIKYVEVSLDSVDPARHDSFRGQPGMWEKAVEGMRNVVAQEGMRLGVAMCVHAGNVDEVEDMLQFAVDMGASCFAHFNFIPVGRGLEMIEGDLSPQKREHLLQTLNKWMQSGKIGILSTAPQFGRVCLAHAPVDGLQSCSHVGGGGGSKARVIAKYLGGCGAGRCYVALEPNGDITPCVYIPHRVMGNIRQRRFESICRNNAFWELLCDRDWRTGHCEVCEFKHYCGGCRARGDAYYGELNAPDPGCLFNSHHWEDLLAGIEPKSREQKPRPEASLPVV